MASYTDRYTLGRDATFRRRVRAAVLAWSYDTLAEDPSGSPDAEEIAERGFAARVAQQPTQSDGLAMLTDRVAEILASKLPDAQIDAGPPATNPTDAQIDTAIPLAVAALGNVKGAGL